MYVLQITKTKVEDKCRINGTTFENNAEWNYCSEMEGTDRENVINYFYKWLPEGMFKREGDTLTYNGGYQEYMEKWVERLTATAKKMLETPMGSFLELVHTIHYPTGTTTQIYEDPNGEEDCAYDIGEWIAFSVKRLNVGDKLYIGGVVFER